VFRHGAASHETRPPLDPAAAAATAAMEAKTDLVICICRELVRERTWSRIHLVPLLLAEGDRDIYRREQAALEREKEIMKDVKGWEVSSTCDLRCVPLIVSRYGHVFAPTSFPSLPMGFHYGRRARVYTTMRDTVA
jgi:hypothetical protein